MQAPARSAPCGRRCGLLAANGRCRAKEGIAWLSSLPIRLRNGLRLAQGVQNRQQVRTQSGKGPRARHVSPVDERYGHAGGGVSGLMMGAGHPHVVPRQEREDAPRIAVLEGLAKVQAGPQMVWLGERRR